MGFLDFAKKVGRGIVSGAKKVGSVAKSVAKKVGDVGGSIVDIAKKIAPYTQGIPVVGQVVSGVAQAGDLVDVAKDIGAGRFEEAAKKGAKFAAGKIPVVGTALGQYERARRIAQDTGIPGAGRLPGLG